MHTIKISLTHSYAKSPKYTFGEQVAIKSNCHPQKWATGRVTGLRLDDDATNTWNYTIILDYPQGYCEELVEDDLAEPNELICLNHH